MTGICKLCLLEKELIKRSHIFPDFMYKGIHDEKGRLNVLNTAQPLKRRFAQSGAYDQYIFCADCDNNILGSLERYASNHLYNKPYLEESKDFRQIRVNPLTDIIECQDLDYNQFKLFLMSLLWRASISAEAMFENFKLDCEQEDFLRSAIHQHSVLDETVFPSLLLTCAEKEVLTDYVVIDASKKGMVQFYINRFVYIFYLDENKKDAETMKLTIRMDHKMAIMKVPPVVWYRIRQTITSAIEAAAKPNLP